MKIEYRTLKDEYRTLKIEYRTLKIEYRTLEIECRTLEIDYRILEIEFRQFLLFWKVQSRIGWNQFAKSTNKMQHNYYNHGHFSRHYILWMVVSVLLIIH